MSTEENTEAKTPSTPRILVGVDGSDDAMRAVKFALGTAERTGQDIWLVIRLGRNTRESQVCAQLFDKPLTMLPQIALDLLHAALVPITGLRLQQISQDCVPGVGAAMDVRPLRMSSRPFPGSRLWSQTQPQQRR